MGGKERPEITLAAPKQDSHFVPAIELHCTEPRLLLVILRRPKNQNLEDLDSNPRSGVQPQQVRNYSCPSEQLCVIV